MTLAETVREVLVAAHKEPERPTPGSLAARLARETERCLDRVRFSPHQYMRHPILLWEDWEVMLIAWESGQVTPIHDHTTWCVFGVLQGSQREEVFDGDLNPIGYTECIVGDVNGFAPPGDIHRVINPGDETAISLHIYGTDISRIGSSVRRYYDLPNQNAAG